MKKKIIFISLFFLLFLGLGTITRAQTTGSTDPTINGLNKAAGQVNAFQNQVPNESTYNLNFFATTAGKVIGAVLAFVGVLFLILVIYGGILWMTAAGNEQTITKARTLIINSIVGLIIVLAAYALVSFLGTQIIQ